LQLAVNVVQINATIAVDLALEVGFIPSEMLPHIGCAVMVSSPPFLKFSYHCFEVEGLFVGGIGESNLPRTLSIIGIECYKRFVVEVNLNIRRMLEIETHIGINVCECDIVKLTKCWFIFICEPKYISIRHISVPINIGIGNIICSGDGSRTHQA
jgi:hypothetical protein